MFYVLPFKCGVPSELKCGVSYYMKGCLLRVHCIVFSPLSTEDFPFVQCNPALWQVVCYALGK